MPYTRHSSRLRNLPFTAAAASAALGAYVCYTHSSSPIRNDTQPTDPIDVKNDGLEIRPKVASKTKINGSTAEAIAQAGEHAIWVWGNNRNNTLLPPLSGSTSAQSTIKTARPTPYIPRDTPLRDLVLAEKYAAAVDAKGDLWLWGNGYWDDAPGNMSVRMELSDSGDRAKAQKSLRGKNITSLAASPGKIYALSSSGDIYAVSSSRALQQSRLSTQNGNAELPKASSWWDTFGLGRIGKAFAQDPGVDCVKLGVSGDGLKKGERFTSLVAGKSHILALTSTGRTFSMGLNPNGNSHSQLGTRTVLPIGNPEHNPSSPQPLVPLLASTSPAQDAISALPPSHDIRYSTKLNQITSLSGIDIIQIAAGENTSFFRTRGEGRVLGLGANAFGQIGLGAMSSVDIVPVPTEIVLAKAYPGGTTLKCLNVAAGANNTYFTVERSATGQPHMRYVDLLAVGSGLTGTLGNGLWSSANGSPVKVKTVSGLQEYSEATQSFVPLDIAKVSVSSSPTPHVFATLHTVALSDAAGVQSRMYGNDCMTWGAGTDYQLGNGKRSNLSVPQHLPPLKGIAKGVIDALGNSDSAPVARETTLGSGTVSPMPHSRLQLHAGKADAYDLEGNLIKRSVPAEQTIYAGHNASAVYWKIA